MKKNLAMKTMFIGIMFITSLYFYAQTGINYKALITENGAVLANQNVTFRFTVLENGTTQVYRETQTATTDANGIVSVHIGEGTVVSGDFSTIDWSLSQFLKVEIDTGSGYTDFGTTELKFVPKAKYAEKAGSVSNISINDLSDGKYVGNSLFLGFEVGDAQTATGIGNTGVGHQALKSNTTGSWNSAFGYKVLLANTTGEDNTALGYQALSSNTTGNQNTAIGSGTLHSNTNRSYLVAIGYQALYHNGQGANSGTIESKHNTAIGANALYSNTTGYDNTANGYQALYSNTTGDYNTANGSWALNQNTTGNNNTANGTEALSSNTTGNNNTANGYQALMYNTTGYNNTANGNWALYANTTGKNNTASGTDALIYNTTGNNNVANGFDVLHNNTTGSNNTANGYKALYSNTTGVYNTANGSLAMNHNTTGNNNTAIGSQALYANTTGDYNTANGVVALFSNTTGDFNTANGYYALYSNTTGSYNTALGHYAFYSGNYTNSTALGDGTTITADGQVRIGHNVSSIGGPQAWTNTSDARFKKEIKDSKIGLDFILKLRPVTYYLDQDAMDAASGLPKDYLKEKSAKTHNNKYLQTGFIAQEVEQAAQSLGYDFNGVDAPKNANDHYGLRYALFVVPLVKAVQEQQHIIERQEKTIEQLKTQMQMLLKRMEKLEKNP